MSLGRFLLVCFACLCVAWQGSDAQGQERGFKGRFELVDNPGGRDGKLKRLKYDFGYVAPDGTGWEAAAGLETDGASIPDWAIPIIGGRYDEQFIKAAVLHDHYCARKVRTWEDTHRMFYHALRSQNVPDPKALAMFYAVFNFGPKWQIATKGRRCNTVEACTRSVVVEEQSQAINVSGASLASIEGLTRQLSQIEADIEAGRLPASVEGLERHARLMRPDDWYFRNPPIVEIPPSGAQ